MIKTFGFTFLLSITLLMMAACDGSSSQKREQPSTVNEAKILLQYLEDNGNIVNHPDIPFFINAEEVYNNLLGSNYLVIDLRTTRDFNRGHIEKSVHILPENLLEYIETRIEPNSFEKIVLVCNDSHLSGYATAILRMLGYNNIYNMRFGLSSWNESVARRHWSANLSDDLMGRLETTPHAKNKEGNLPLVKTSQTTGYDILREQAQRALQVNWSDISISYLDILEETENYYVINYWPQALYETGHLPGAIQYNPKKAFHSTEDIFTLPTDQPVVVYCFTGQNAAYANAFLSIMGYEFRSLDYGANSFIHQTMITTQPPGRAFSEIHIKNYPLVRDGLLQKSAASQKDEEVVEVSTVQGGC